MPPRLQRTPSSRLKGPRPNSILIEHRRSYVSDIYPLTEAYSSPRDEHTISSLSNIPELSSPEPDPSSWQLLARRPHLRRQNRLPQQPKGPRPPTPSIYLHFPRPPKLIIDRITLSNSPTGYSPTSRDTTVRLPSPNSSESSASSPASLYSQPSLRRDHRYFRAMPRHSHPGEPSDGLMVQEIDWDVVDEILRTTSSHEMPSASLSKPSPNRKTTEEISSLLLDRRAKYIHAMQDW